MDSNASAVPMSYRRFWFGIIMTALWVCVGVWAALRQPDVWLTMKPNDWADFFGGFSAPIAFLWLVLGYLQQGEELRLSTRALHLQAEELRNSVEQQRQLVEVS